MERTQKEKNEIINAAAVCANALSIYKFKDKPFGWAIHTAAQTFCPEDVELAVFQRALAVELRRRYNAKVQIGKAKLLNKNEQLELF